MYARPRTHVRERRDKGKPGKFQPGKTLAAFARKKHKNTTEQVKRYGRRDMDVVQRVAATQVHGTWSDEHDAEFSRQKLLASQARISSITSGTLLPTEVTQDDRAIATARVDHLKKLRATRKRHSVQKDMLVKRRRFSIPFRSTVHFDEGLPQSDINGLRQAALKKHCLIVQDRLKASVFVSRDPTCPSTLTAWAAFLNGGVVCDPNFFNYDGAGGTSTVYLSACASGGNSAANGKRLLWISTKFKTQNPLLFKLIESSTKLATSTWALVTAEQFARYVDANKARCARQQRNMQAVGLVDTAAEKAPILGPNSIV